MSIIDTPFNEKETHNTQKIIAEIRERSESGTFTRSNNLLLQPIDPNTNAAATKLATNFNTNRTYINEAARI